METDYQSLNFFCDILIHINGFVKLIPSLLASGKSHKTSFWKEICCKSCVLFTVLLVVNESVMGHFLLLYVALELTRPVLDRFQDSSKTGSWINFFAAFFSAFCAAFFAAFFDAFLPPFLLSFCRLFAVFFPTFFPSFFRLFWACFLALFWVRSTNDMLLWVCITKVCCTFLWGGWGSVKVFLRTACCCQKLIFESKGRFSMFYFTIESLKGCLKKSQKVSRILWMSPFFPLNCFTIVKLKYILSEGFKDELERFEGSKSFQNFEKTNLNYCDIFVSVSWERCVV